MKQDSSLLGRVAKEMMTKWHLKTSGKHCITRKMEMLRPNFGIVSQNNK